MSKITLRYDRSDKQIDLSWTLTNISTAHPIIVVADNTLNAHKRIVLDPGTTSYTVEMDAYFTAHQDRANEFVVIGTKAGTGNEGVLVTSNQISVAMIEIPTPKYSLVPLNKAFKVNFAHNLNSQGTEDGQFHDQLGKQSPPHSSYDTGRKITQVVVSVTTINPLAMWQAVYNVTGNNAMTGNEITVGYQGLVPAATSKPDLVSVGLINHQKYEVNVSYVSDETKTTGPDDANANAEGSLGAGAEGTTEAQYVVPSTRLSAPQTLTIVETPDSNNTVDIYWKAPDNDFGQEANTKLTTVTKYQIFVNSANKTPNFLATPDNGWTQVDSDIAMQADSTKTEVYSLLKQAQNAGDTKYYTIRAVRSVDPASDTADADRDGTDDNVSYGEFHAVVTFTNFVHVGLAAPALSDFSAVVDKKEITFNASSPSNATTPALTATGYTAQKLVVKMKGTDGANGAHTAEQTYNLQVNEQIYSGVKQTIDKLSNNDPLTNGITYQITSAIYEQPGLKIKLGDPGDGSSQQTLGTEAETYKSAETTPAASTGRTLFTTPAAVANPASTALNTDNTPLSTATNGRLKLSWTKLTAYDKVGEANSKFFSEIIYRVSGAVQGPNNTLTTLEKGNDSTGSSPVENLKNSPLTVENLTVGSKYAALKIQAYFYNTEMGVWVMGTETSVIANGNVPFYYPDAVTALAYNSSKNGVTWKNPAKDNGVNLSDEVVFYYEVGLITNNANPSGAADNDFSRTWQAAANADNTKDQSTALGSSYAVRVISGYRTNNGSVDKGLATTRQFAYLARPADPSVTLVAGDKKIDATFATNTNDASMVFNRFMQAQDSADLKTNDKTTTKAYTGLDNGTRYDIKVQTVYTYPGTGGAEFTSAIVSSTNDLNEIPFGKPIFADSNPVTISNSPNPGVVTVANMKNNGRKLREMLVVGIPVDTDAGQQIVIKRFDNVANNDTTDVSAGEDNNVPRTLTDVTFGKNLKQAFVVLENEAGSTASLSA